MGTDGEPNSVGIIVLGMHRSGTSVATEAVVRWGAYANQESLVQADSWNPNGYWEYAPLVALNDQILAKVRASWRIPPSEESQEKLIELAQHGSFRRRALRLLEETRANNKPWVWKDPRLCILLPFWQQIWGRVIYLVPVRNPIEVAKSLYKRRDFTEVGALLLWQRYMSLVISNQEVLQNAMFFSYENLMESSEATCSQICRFLDEHSGTDVTRRQDRIEQMLQAIDPKLRRNRSSSFLEPGTAQSPEQLRLYEVLMECAQGDHSCSNIELKMPADWRKSIAQDVYKHDPYYRLKKFVLWKAWTVQWFFERVGDVFQRAE